jgi:hypothetical protein
LINHEDTGFSTEVNLDIGEHHFCIDLLVYDKSYMKDKYDLNGEDEGDDLMKFYCSKVIVERKKGDYGKEDQIIDLCKEALRKNRERTFIYSLGWGKKGFMVYRVERRSYSDYRVFSSSFIEFRDNGLWYLSRWRDVVAGTGWLKR